MTLARLAFASAAFALSGLILWAIPAASLSGSFGAIIADPWGLVTLVDLYLGFLGIGLVMALVEADRRLVLALWLALFGLGNVVGALWLAWRLPLLVRRLAATAGAAR